MRFPFGNVIVDDNSDPNTIYFFNPKYKQVPIGIGEPTRFREEIDWDATAKDSAVIYNIGDKRS